MPDFDQLYSNPVSDAPVTPDPKLTPIESPSMGGGDNSNYINNQLDNFQKQFSQPSVGSMLEPVTYNPETTNRDRYTKSDYFGELGFNPFSDNEEIYGDRQTRMNKLKNAFEGMGSLAAHQFADQFTSWGDTFSMFKDPTTKDAFQQMEMERLYKQQNDFANNYPLFETQAEHDSVWNFNTIANTIQQSGYAVGAVAEIAAEEAAMTAITTATFGATAELQAARFTKLAMKFGDVIKNTEELSRSVSEAQGMRKIFSNMSKILPLDNMADFALNAGTLARADRVAMDGSALAGLRTVSRGFGSFYRDVRELNAAISEAKAEAAGTYGDLYKGYVQDYQNDHKGADPDDLTQQSMKANAMQAAQINGAVNTAALLITNKLAFGNIFKGFKPVEQAAQEDMMKGILVLSEKDAAKNGGNRLVDAATNKWLAFRQRVLASPWSVLKYTEHNLGEALQENFQDMSNDAVSAYYKAKYDGKSMEWADAVKKSASDEYSTQGGKTFISSFFTGAIMAGGEMAFEHAPQIKNFVTDRAQYGKDKADHAATKQYIMNTVNSIIKDPLNFTLNRTNAAPLQANFGALLTAAATGKDQKGFNDIKDDATREYVMAGIKSGTLDLINNRMQDYIKNLNPTEFTKAFGIEYSQENHDNILKQVDVFKGRSKDIKETYENLATKFPNPFNPFIHDKKSTEYTKQALGYTAYQNAIDNLVFMKDSYKRGIERQNDVLDTVRKMDGVKDVPFSTIYTLTSSAELQKEIATLHLEAAAATDIRTKNATNKKIQNLEAYHKDLNTYLDGYHKAVTTTLGAEQVDRIHNLDAEAIGTFSKHLAGLFNQDLVNDGKNKMLDEDVTVATSQLMDYYKLQHEGGLMLDNVNLIANPKNFNEYLNRHVQAVTDVYNKLSEQVNPSVNREGKVYEVDGVKYHVLKQNEDGSLNIQREEGDKFIKGTISKEALDKWVSEGKFNEVPKAGPKEITLKAGDKDISLKEGDVFVGKMSEEPGVYKEQTATRYNNDKIKIHAISPETNSALVTINNDEGRAVPLQYLANRAASENWVNYDKLGPIQKAYLDLRNQALQYRVIKKDVEGKTVYNSKTGKADSQVVTGRVRMNKEKNGMNFVYLDPATQKEKTVDFNPKWLVDRKNIQSQSEAIRQGLEAESKRRKDNLITQRNYLSSLITDTESKLAKTQELREINERDATALNKEINDAHEEFRLAGEELERLGRGGNRDYRKQLKSIRESIPLRITSMETKLSSLQEERDNLNGQLEALNKTREVLYQGLDEVERTNQPFDKEGNDDLTTGLQSHIDELEAQQITAKYSPEELDNLIKDTRSEVDALDKNIENLNEIINKAKKLLSEFSVYDKVLDNLTELAGHDYSNHRLRDQLISAQKKETDPYAILTYQALIADLGRGDSGIVPQMITKAAASLKNASNQISKLAAQRDELAAKEFRLTQTKDQQERISGLKNRAEFLKDIQTALTSRHEEIKGEVRKQQARKAEEARQFSELKGLPDQAISQDTKTFEHEGQSKPIFDSTALFKTAGQHYTDKEDTKLNAENRNDAFFRFSETADTENLYLQPVTATNDEHGIRREDVYKDDIKLVAVRKVGDKFVPVGVDGKELAFPHKGNLIYTSMHGNNILLGSDKAATVKYIRDNYVAGNQTDDQIWSTVQAYKGTRDQIRDAVNRKEPIYLEVTGKSNGIQTILPKDSITGLPQELNVAGRLVAEGTKDWSKMKHPNGQGIQLEVSTSKTPIKGILPGRLIMKRDDGTVFRVFNRQMNQSEKDNFINILKNYSQLFGAENLTKEQEKTRDDIREYLKNVVFWSLPQSENGGKNLAGDQFWISNGYIHRSKTASSIPFNEQDIEANRDDLTKDLYHAVNNFTLKANKPYTELNWKDGKLVRTEWSTYSHYLLGERSDGSAPVYTNIPTYESPDSSTTPQIKSVYLKYATPSEYNKVNAGTPAGAAKITNETATGQTLVNNNQDLTRLPKDKPVVYTIKKKSDGKEAFITTNWDAAQSKWVVSKITDTDNVDLTSKAKDFYEKDINDTLTELVNVEGRPDGAFNTIGDEFRHTYYRIGDSGIIKTTQPETKSIQEVATTLATGIPEKTLATAPLQTQPATVVETQAPTELNQSLLNKIFSKEYQASMPDVEDELRYRLPVSEITKTEDFHKVQDWFKKNLPQFPVNKLEYLIHGKAWGQFTNGAIHIYENAGAGTGMHEAFEAVWGSYLHDTEQQDLINEFRGRDGSFTNPFSGEIKEYSKATAYDVREMLAEEFGKYVDAKENNITQPKTLVGKILDFFKDLWKTIKSYIGLGKEKQEDLNDKVNTIFQRINSGYFAHEAPVRDLNNGIGEYRLPNLGVSQEVTKYAMEGLTSTFFSKLFYGRNNIDSLVGNNDNALLTHKLMNDTFNTFEDSLLSGARYYLNQAEKALNRPLTDQEKLDVVNRYRAENPLFNQVQNLLNKREDLQAGLQTYLSRFGLEFNPVPVDDKIQAELEKEETATNPLGILDAISIDPRKLTSANVNMLIASLTDDEYRNGVRIPKLSPLGLPKLVDFNKTRVTLLNELSGTVPVIRDGKRVNTIDQMFERLDAKYKLNDGTYKPGYVWIAKLKTRLRLEEHNGDPVQVQNLSADDIRMLVGFEKSFTNNLMNPSKLVVGPDNYMYDTNPLTDTNKTRVRTEWENNAKARVNPNRTEPGKMVYADHSSGELMINRDSTEFKEFTGPKDNVGNIDGFTKALSKLGYLGMAFTEDPKILFYKTTNGKLFRTIVEDSINRISNALKDGQVISYADLYSKRVVNGPVNALVGLQTQMSAEDTILSHLNSEGKQQYSVTLPSNISYILNSLAAVDNQADFIRTNPQLGVVDEQGNVTLNPYQSRSLLISRGGMIFNEDGNKRSNIDYKLISGMALSEDMYGKNTSDLVFPDRVVNEIHNLLNNTHFTVINSDKGNEFGLGFDKQFLSFNDTRIINNNDKVLNVYFDQLADEMDSAYMELANPSHIQYYSDNKNGALKLGHYREILGPALLAKFAKEVLGAKITYNKDKSDFTVDRPSKVISQDEYNKRRDEFLNTTAASDIQKKIEGYLNGYVADTISKLVDLDIFQRFPVESNGRVTGYRYATSAVSSELLNKTFGTIVDPQNINQNQMEFLTQYLAINKEIGVTEQHKLIYGHPAMYKDLAKRSNGANSNKEAVTDNTVVLDWMDKNMERIDGKVRNTELHQTFNHITHADVNVASNNYSQYAQQIYESMIADRGNGAKKDIEKSIGAEFDDNGRLNKLILNSGKPTGLMKAYLSMDEGDGQGHIMPDFYRDMLYLSSKWSKEQEDQWQYEKAYETVARSQKSKRDPAYKEYSPEEIKAAQQILRDGNPGAVLQPLKPQYFGYVADAIHHTTFLKHSVQPKFYRFVEGTQFESKYLQAQNNQIDVMDYGSGQKVGAIYDNNGKLTPTYTDGGKPNADLPPVQKLFTKYYGIQVEVPNAFKDQVVRGTQVTKLVVSNFIVNGKGINAQAEGLVHGYMDTISQLVKLGKQGLVKELGLGVDEHGDYYTSDVTRLVKLLRDEAESRNLPDNTIDAINSIQTPEGNQVLQYKFDSLSNREKIEQILSSIIDSRVISEKMNGMPAVQVSSSLYEKDPRNFMYLKDGKYEQLSPEALNGLSDEERGSIKMTSNDLKFYHLENGKISGMEVYLPWHFTDITPKDLGLTKGAGGIWMADPAKMDKRLLEAIGFRIPTQGMNSIDSIIIKGFLDYTGGNQVVVPSEMVGKSGSDFDIDKLNIYLANYSTKDGELKYIDHDGDSKEALQNRLIRQMKDLIEQPDNYRQLIMPNSTDTLKNLATQIRELKGLSDEESNLTKLRQFLPMSEIRERYLTGKKLVGIGALQITLHTMAQVAGLEMTGKFDGKQLSYLYAHNYKTLLESMQTGALSYQDLRDKVRQMDIKIRLEHNTDKDGNLYLYAKTDRAGSWISELHSEALSGFVDAAKDPFIFDLNLNLDTAATWFYLQKLGVPVKDIAYLHTQPIVEEYFNEVAKNKSIIKQANDDKLSNRDLLLKVASKYYDIPNDNLYDKSTRLLKQALEAKDQGRRAAAKALFNERKELINQFLFDVNNYRKGVDTITTSQLESAISKKGAFNDIEKKFQLGNLFDYLEYKQQASQLSDFIKGITYDTNATRTIADNRLQEAKWNKTVSQKFIKNPDSVLNNTFIGAMKEQKEDVYNLLQDFFTSLHPKALPAFSKIIDRINNFDLYTSQDAQMNMMNRYQNFFLTYLLHTIPFKSGEIQTTLNNRYGLLFGDQSMAHQLVGLKESSDPAVKNNPVVKELIGLFSNNARETSNISLFRKNMDSYDTNVMVEGILNLWQHAKAIGDTKLQKFTENLSTLSLVQSGLQNSRISIGKILPNELYSNMVGSILDNFTNGESQISGDLVYKQFHQNNWWNKDIAPVVKSDFIKFKREEGNIIGLDSTSDTALNDYLVRYAMKPGIDTKTYDQMKREGRGMEAFDTLLYERVLIKDGNNNDITNDGDLVYFKRINKLGNRQYFTEAYSHDNQKSMIAGNQYFDERSLQPTVDNLVSSAKQGNNTFDNFDSQPADEVTQVLEGLDAGCGGE